MEDRFSERRRQFKKGGTLEESRRAREDETVQIRKKEREEQLARRRRLDEGMDREPEGMPEQGAFAGGVSDTQTSVLLHAKRQIETGTLEQKLEGVRTVRKLLSLERNAPIGRVVELGLVPYMLELMQTAESFPELQFEAAWALTNVASGTSEQTQTVVDQGGIPAFIRLLSSPNIDVVEQSIWGLGNIAGDDIRYRNLILSQRQTLEQLVLLLRHTEKLSVIRNITWCIGNFCRGKPGCDLDRIRPVLPVLVNLLHHQDNEVVADAAWALGYVSDGSNDRIQAVIEAGAVMRLVELLGHSSALLATPALRAIGNIVTGDETQTDVVVRCGAVPQLLGLLSHPKKNIRKEACWAVSNITAGNPGQIQTVINTGIFAKLVDILERGEYDLKKEAVWATCNAMSEGSLDQIKFIAGLGVIPPLIGVLKVRDTRMVLVVLEALNQILKAGKMLVDRGDYPENPYLRAIEECDGLGVVEDLQLDDNEEIYLKAVAVISHFPVEEGPEGGFATDMTSSMGGFLQPNNTAGSNFNF